MEYVMQTQVRAVCPHDCPDTCAMLVAGMGRAPTFYDTLVQVEKLAL